MSPTVEQLVERAWRALWRDGSPYHLPTALQHGRLSGHVRVRPLASLPLPDVSDVVLLDRPPWGGVTLSLEGSRLEGLSSIADGGCQYDPQSGQVTAHVRFSGLRCAGGHLVRTGHRTGAAVASAMTALQADPGDTDSNITLAKSYEQQLIGMQSDSGRVMVASYYENNDTYAELFQTLPSFVQVWSQHTTNGQTTKFYAGQTSNAAQPGNTSSVSVNGQPDEQGFSPYNFHSFFMQNFVMYTCYVAASHYGTSTEKGKRYTKAGDSAQQFGVPVKPQSMKPQTVDQVMATVAASTPPGKEDLVLQAGNDPPWLKEAQAKAQAMASTVIQKDLVGGGINTASLARPVRGTFSGAVPDVPFTLGGRIVPAGPDGHPTVTFTTLDGPSLDVAIALSDLPADLSSDVETAIERARFLKRLLGHRAALALASDALLDYFSFQMNLALAQRLGATG
jgi:hypothetical protein